MYHITTGTLFFVRSRRHPHGCQEDRQPLVGPPGLVTHGNPVVEVLPQPQLELALQLLLQIVLDLAAGGSTWRATAARHRILSPLWVAVRGQYDDEK